MSLWVVNTSPLVFLGHLGRLDLLRREGRSVCIPRAVFDEVRAKPDVVARAVETACSEWMGLRDVKDQASVELIEVDLHKGEAEAVVLAKELAAESLVLDDQDARRFAARRGLHVIGTVGILLAAFKRREIGSLRQELDRLLALGFRISPRLLAAALIEAGE